MSFAFWLNCKLSSKHILGCCSVLFMTHTNRIFLKTNNYTKESALEGGSFDFSGFYSVPVSSSGWFHLGSLMFQQCYCRCYGVFDMLLRVIYDWFYSLWPVIFFTVLSIFAGVEAMVIVWVEYVIMWKSILLLFRIAFASWCTYAFRFFSMFFFYFWNFVSFTRLHTFGCCSHLFGALLSDF